ncbi:hypothetical protein ACHAPO_011731 [Fusarium lateritium]
MHHFQYITLLPQEIRVLELEPGAIGDNLVGNIRHKVLSPKDNEIPKFEALSYTWGGPSQPQSISLRNDATSDNLVSTSERIPLNIGNNLAVALRALRLPTEKRVLWCDQICINQADLGERGRQVQRMADVYRFAGRVVVWLGPETSWSTMVMETMRWANEQILSITAQPDCYSYQMEFKESSDIRVYENDDPLPLTAAQWRAFEQLIALDWHKRLWTYQEIALADETTCIIKLGNEEMSKPEFLKALNLVACVRRPPPGLLDEPTFFFNVNLVISKFTTSVMDLRGTPVNNWIDLMVITKAYECSDVRDKIFAMQGLVESDLAISLKPDYTKSAKDIFTSICLDHIEKSRDIEFLNLCNAAKSPSWVADLERPSSWATGDDHVTAYSITSACLVEPGILEVAGIKGAELFNDPVPLVIELYEQSQSDFTQKVVSFLRDFVSGDEYQNDSCLDKFIMMLTGGAVRDFNIQRCQAFTEGALHSLQEWRWKIRQWLNGTGDEADSQTDYWLTDKQFISTLSSTNTATGCAKTCDGDFVRVPPESRSGDIIAVLLGSHNPIVLRPQSPSGYTVIGPCYHPGLSHGKALLGNDFRGWIPVWDRMLVRRAFYKVGYGIRRTDPRLDDVPLEDGYRGILFKKAVLGWESPEGSISMFDPRMSEEALKKRGVPIRKFRLL